MARQRHRRLVLDGREHGGTLTSAGAKVLSEVDASVCVRGWVPHRAERCAKAISRLIEVTFTTVPAGADAGVAMHGPDWAGLRASWPFAPIELGSVAPDAVQDDLHPSGDRDLCLLEANALNEPQHIASADVDCRDSQLGGDYRQEEYPMPRLGVLISGAGIAGCTLAID